MADVSIEQIVAMLNERRGAQGRVLSMMREVRDTYNAEIAIPLPELDSDERSSVANLLRQGLDGNAQRISSTMPDVTFPVLRPGIKKSQDDARDRRRVTLGWWEMSDMEIVLARRARHFIGYGASPVLVRPDVARGVPVWEPRDPMAAFPAPAARLDDMRPCDCIFTFTRSLGWLQANYPGPVAVLAKGNATADTRFECVEYVDDEVSVLGVIGEQTDSFGSPTLGSQAGAYRDTRGGGGGRQRNVVVGGGGGGNGYGAVQLERTVNYAGVCPVVMPGRVTLDRLAGQFDGMIGQYIQQARLTALELIAIEEGIFPKVWLVSRQGETGKVITMANGRAGRMGKVEGGDIVPITLNPGYKTDQAIDRLAEAQRQEGGVPAGMSGMAPTNVRTARQSDTVLSSQIDFSIQEAQKLLARSISHEDEIAVAVAKGWFGSRKTSFYVDWKGAQGQATYRPDDLFPEGTSRNVVRYAMAGTDLNQQSVRLGQKLAEGVFSKQTVRELDPEVPDAEKEHDRVTVEALESALLAGIAAQAQQGAIPPADLARMMLLVGSNEVELAEAVNQVHEEAQARQATSGPAGTPEGPVEPGSPEAQPGIAQPGAGAEAGVTPPGPSLDDFAQRLGQLGRVRSAIRAA